MKIALHKQHKILVWIHAQTINSTYLLVSQNTYLLFINSLTAIDGHDCPLFNKLRACAVSPQISVCCQCLMARKVAELFGLNCGIRPFYAACCFDELSRGSASCLLNASFKTVVSQRHNLIFWAKIDDHDVRRGDTGQILAQWRHLMASMVSLDLQSWAMRSAL